MKGCKERALTECLESTKEIKIDKNDQLAAKVFTYINGKAYPFIPKGKNPEIPTDKCRKVPKGKYPEIPKVPGKSGKVPKYPENPKVPGKSGKVPKYPEIPKVPGKSGKVPKYPEIPKVPGKTEKVRKYTEIPKVERKRKKVKSVGDEEIKRAKLELPSEKEDVNETSTVTDTEDTIKLDKLAQKRARFEQNLEMQKRTIFVGNIPPSATKKEIEQIFCQYGKIQSVRSRKMGKAVRRLLNKCPDIMKKFRDIRSNYDAYVRFECQDSAEAALVHNGHIYNGFHLRVDRSTEQNNLKHDNKRSVYVGNISYETEEEAVMKHFLDCGEIEDIRIIRDHITGVGKGFGFILFKSADSVQLAIRMNEASFLEGRRIHVKQPVSKETTEDAYGNEIRTKNGFEPR